MTVRWSQKNIFDTQWKTRLQMRIRIETRRRRELNIEWDRDRKRRERKDAIISRLNTTHLYLSSNRWEGRNFPQWKHNLNHSQRMPYYLGVIFQSTSTNYLLIMQCFLSCWQNIATLVQICSAFFLLNSQPFSSLDLSKNLKFVRILLNLPNFRWLRWADEKNIRTSK